MATLLERLITFLPLGFVVHRELDRRRLNRPKLVAWCAIVLFALAIELTQAVVVARHARLSDLLVAAAWGTIGILLSAWLGRGPVAPARIRALLQALLILGNAVNTFAVADAHLGKAIAGWDCGYPLIVANEASADRPWRGKIRGLALYPRALTADDVAHLAAVPFSLEGARERQAAGALMIYDFDAVDGQRVAPVSPGSPADDLMLPPPGPSSWQADEGALEVLGPVLIRGDQPPRALCAAVVASGALAVEVEVASRDLGQEGPARIVTQSIDPFQRNFTLGQDRRALVLRVRTPWNGPNGTRIELRAENALLDQDWHHVVATYGRGVETLFVDAKPSVSMRQDELTPLSETRIVPLAAFVAFGFAALGGVVGLLTTGRSWRSRLGCAYLGAALVPTAVALVLARQLGHDLDWWLVAAAVVAPAAGLLAQMASARLIASRQA